jgi:NitT/TauT family transport system substrate-binding protein
MTSGRKRQGGLRFRPDSASLATTILGWILLLTSCTAGGSGAGPTSRIITVGLFANLTHAPAILCVERGYFQTYLDKATGDPGRLEVQLFESGPQAVEAIFSGSIDFAYMGPSPAVNGFLRSGGQSLRIVAGSTSGGASLVVQPEITSVADLYGKVLATPQLGNTQDIAARAWLAAQGIRTDPRGGGDVMIAPRPGPQIFEGFRARQISGAWVPEPLASRLVVEAGGRVMVDERDLWPQGRFSTTVAVATPNFIDGDAAALDALLRAHLNCIEQLVSADPPTRLSAQTSVNDWIARNAGRSLSAQVVERAWEEVTFTADPLSDTILARAKQAADMGLLPAFDDAKIAALIYDGPLERAEQPLLTADKSE